MIKVYGFRNTRTTHVTWALEEAGAEYELIPVNQFTCADILISGILNWARKMGVNLESPALDAYADRMSARPKLARARQREADVSA
jgi:glutathione S-transferase